MFLFQVTSNALTDSFYLQINDIQSKRLYHNGNCSIHHKNEQKCKLESQLCKYVSIHDQFIIHQSSLIITHQLSIIMIIIVKKLNRLKRLVRATVATLHH